jgi:hypothetical protein
VRPSHPNPEHPPVDVRLVAILAARGLTPTDADMARIMAVRDAAQLGDLLRRAVSCKSVAELLG